MLKIPGIYTLASWCPSWTKQKKVTLKSGEYLVNPTLLPIAPKEPDGPLLLRHVITMAHLDTNATNTAARKHYAKLECFVDGYQGDIKAFNKFVQNQLNKLAA